MKNIATTATIVLISLGSSICMSCNDNANNKINDNIDTMSSRIDANADEVKDNYEDYKDERFINDVLETNEKEVHLLNLAIQKSTSTAIKAHAKKMLADHKKMDVDLRAYATANNFEISYKTDVKSALDEDMASVEWDKKWLDKMIDEHEDVIKKFERKEKKVDEGGLKTIVVNTLPTLRDHLNSVKSLEEKM